MKTVEEGLKEWETEGDAILKQLKENNGVLNPGQGEMELKRKLMEASGDTPDAIEVESGTEVETEAEASTEAKSNSDADVKADVISDADVKVDAAVKVTE